MAAWRAMLGRRSACSSHYGEHSTQKRAETPTDHRRTVEHILPWQSAESKNQRHDTSRKRKANFDKVLGSISHRLAPFIMDWS